MYKMIREVTEFEQSKNRKITFVEDLIWRKMQSKGMTTGNYGFGMNSKQLCLFVVQSNEKTNRK